MKRRILLVGTSALLAVIAVPLALWLTTPPMGVTMRNLHRLRAGMTKAEVEAILGAAPVANERTGPTSARWQSNELIVDVAFDDDALTCGYCGWCAASEKPEDGMWVLVFDPPWSERIRGWLRLP